MLTKLTDDLIIDAEQLLCVQKTIDYQGEDKNLILIFKNFAREKEVSFKNKKERDEVFDLLTK